MNDNDHEPARASERRTQHERELDALTVAQRLAQRGQAAMLCGDCEYDVSPPAHLTSADLAELDVALTLREFASTKPWPSCGQTGLDLSVSCRALAANHRLRGVDGQPAASGL